MTISVSTGTVIDATQSIFRGLIRIRTTIDHTVSQGCRIGTFPTIGGITMTDTLDPATFKSHNKEIISSPLNIRFYT